jgi:hypothetical protein
MNEEMTADEVLADRRRLRPPPHAQAGSPLVSLLLLDDREFELLAHALLESESTGNASHDQARLLQRGPDRGRDILLYKQSRLAGIVQCKRKRKRIGLPEIKAEILRYALHAARNPKLLPDGETLSYALWTAFDLTEEAGDFFYDATARDRLLTELTPQDIEQARRGYTTLAPSKDEDEAGRETSLALRIVSRLQPRHVGPEHIWRRLAENTAIRRSFFRFPSDAPPRAEVSEIDGLVCAYRHDLVEEIVGRKSDPHVPRLRLKNSFDDFLSDNAQIFVLVAGSGQGKTSWAARLLDQPPELRSVDMIRAEDIAPEDVHFAATLTRLLKAGRMPAIPVESLQQAVWDWIDAGNRLFVVDGLDRVVASAQETLPGWLRRSASQAASSRIRLVLTSRQEAWRSLVATLEWPLERVYGGDASRTSIDLGLLDPSEADEIYAAYGVSKDDHPGAHLDSPSLIKQFSLLKADAKEGIVTRADVIAADAAALEAELARRPNVGSIAAAHLLKNIGHLLLKSPDGWIPVDELTGPSVTAAEQLLLLDRARIRDFRLRLSSDDLIEHLLGSALDPDTAAQMLQSGRAAPLFIGGVASMVARLERAGAADSALDTILAGATPGATTILEAVSRSIVEIRNPAAFLRQARAGIALWKQQNLFLHVSNLRALLEDGRIPPAERLRLMIPLAHLEEEDDWREKYWFRPELGGRIVTPFASAAERAVREDPKGTFSDLVTMLEHELSATRAVAAFLLRAAAFTAPEAAISAAWREQGSGRKWVLEIVSSTVPGPAITFLAGLVPHEAGPADIVPLLRRLANLSGFGTRHVPATDEEVVSAASHLLSSTLTPELEVQLLLTSLSRRKDGALRLRLIQLWSAVDDNDYWTALALCGSDRERLLEMLLRGSDPDHDRGYVLERMAPEAVAGSDIGDSLSLMGELAHESKDHARAVALAVEMLLYQIAPADDPEEALLHLALDLSESPHDEVRGKLIYYAGSPVRRSDVPAGEIERRERILERLVDHETGGTLGQLLWKLAESADERPDPLSHGLRLVGMFGLEEVIAPIDRLSVIPYIRQYRDDLEDALNDRHGD